MANTLNLYNLSEEHWEIAKANGLALSTVYARLRDSNGDIEYAISPKKNRGRKTRQFGKSFSSRLPYEIQDRLLTVATQKNFTISEMVTDALYVWLNTYDPPKE